MRNLAGVAASSTNNDTLPRRGLKVQDTNAPTHTPGYTKEQMREMFKSEQIVLGMRTENLENPQPCLCCGQSVSEYHDVGKLDTPGCLCTMCALDVTKD
jgi:hypothetical protein